MSLLAVCGCGDGVTPEITELRFIGQAPDAPLVVITELSFLDDDGDLGEGRLETFVNNRPSGLGELELIGYFLFAEMPLNTRVGSFEFQLELSPNDDTETAAFDLGFRLTDAAGHVGTTKSLRLNLER